MSDSSKSNCMQAYLCAISAITGLSQRPICGMVGRNRAGEGFAEVSARRVCVDQDPGSLQKSIKIQWRGGTLETVRGYRSGTPY